MKTYTRLQKNSIMKRKIWLLEGSDCVIQKNMYVEVHNVIFEGGKRTAKLPDDTKNVPYEMYQKGFLIDDASIGEIVKIETITGRIVKGKLVRVNPTYDLGYGSFVPHILKIKKILRDEING